MINHMSDRMVLADHNRLYSKDGVERFRLAFTRELSRCKSPEDALKLFNSTGSTIERFTCDCQKRKSELEDAKAALMSFTTEMLDATRLPLKRP